MAFIGSLITTVKANTNPLKKSMKSAGKTIAKFAHSVKKVAAQVAKFGLALGVAVVTGATAASIAILKLASDFQEADQKFGVVFGSVAAASSAARADLVKNFGMSKTAATSLLSSTGDLLTGFGMTDKAALKMSSDVQKLSVDLASFNNTQGGSARVSRILTKALLGQRDGLTELGIGILDADVKLRLAEKGQSKLAGTAKRVAIAYATMELAMEQTGKAQGDFSRSSNSLENLLKTLRARADDLGTALGNKLLIPASTLAKKFLTLAETGLKWADSNQAVVDSKILETVTDLTKGIEDLNKAIKLGSGLWNNFAGTFKHGVGVISDGIDTAARQLKSVGPEKTWFGHFADELHKFGDEDLAQAKKSFEDYKKALGSNTGNNFIKNIETALKQAALDKKMNAFKTSIDSAFKSGKDKVQGFASSLGNAFDQMVGISEMTEKIKKNLEKQKEAAKGAMVIFNETRTPLENIESKIKDIMKIANEGGFKGMEDALHRKITALNIAKQKLLHGDKIGQSSSDNSIVSSLRKNLMTPIQKVMAREQELKDVKSRGGFQGDEDLFQKAMRDLLHKAEAIDMEDRKKREKKKLDELGSFKELDLKNVDIKGLAGKENVEKKQLSEAEKTNKLLKQLVVKDESKGAVAV
jgi:hypothetical protein